jgi:hypothetical protein
MTDFITISGNIDSSNTKIPLGVEVWIDNNCIINTDHVDSNIQFNQEIPDDESDHELRIVLKNKIGAYTKVDDQNQIIEDAVLFVNDLWLEGVQLNYTCLQHMIYTHDFNGTGAITHDKFYGEMGCNGTLSLKFTSPVYLWLLENM